MKPFLSPVKKVRVLENGWNSCLQLAFTKTPVKQNNKYQ